MKTLVSMDSTALSGGASSGCGRAGARLGRTLTLPRCRQLQCWKEVFTTLQRAENPPNNAVRLWSEQLCDDTCYSPLEGLDLLRFGWAHSYHPCHITSSLDPKKPWGLSKYVIHIIPFNKQIWSLKKQLLHSSGSLQRVFGPLMSTPGHAQAFSELVVPSADSGVAITFNGFVSFHQTQKFGSYTLPQNPTQLFIKGVSDTSSAEDLSLVLGSFGSRCHRGQRWERPRATRASKAFASSGQGDTVCLNGSRWLLENSTA